MNVLSLRFLALGALALAAVLSLPSELWAQNQPIGSQSLRAYWHVFLAYAAAWLLVGGWAFSIFRRLGRIERKLSDDG